jgi:hypothetical protein
VNHENAFVQYMVDTYEPDELEDIATHGCESGCAGTMIYYSETVALFDKYRDELFDIVGNYQEAIGDDDDLPEYVRKNAGTFKTFANAMVWTAAEIVANELINEEA